MLELATVALLTLCACGLGTAILRGLGPAPAALTDRLALAVPLGLGGLALGTLGLGAAGLLTRPALLALLGAGFVAGLAGLRGRPANSPAIARDEPAAGSPGFGGLDAAIGLALVLGLVGTFVQALTPVADGDALCYHLQVPKVFLERGATGFEPDLHETVYPMVVEMLYADVLAFAGPAGCRLIGWVFGLAFAANVAAIARPALGRRAWWAGAIAVLAPAVSNGMSAPLNDVALAAGCAATLHAFLRWSDRPSARAAALAGLLGGVAIGVKYPALPWVGLVGLGFLARAAVPGGRAARLGQAAIFASTVVAVGGWWYLRSYLHTGNPVFPYFREVFGSGIDEVLEPSTRPLAVTLPNLLTALVPMTLQPGRFDSLAHQFGPVFLLFLPGLLVMRPPRRVALVAAFGFAFLTLCVTQRQSMRFVLAALGPFAVGVAWLAAEWTRRGLAGRLLAGMLAISLLAQGGLALARPRHAAAYLLGRESAEDHLARVEPTWRVGRWIDANLPPDARLVGQDHRGFYIPRPYAMELAHRRRTGLAARGESSGEIIATLRGQGFTHLMLCPPDPEDAVEFDPTLGRRLAPWLEGREPLYREALADGDGVVRRYAIYALDDGPRLASGRDGRTPR